MAKETKDLEEKKTKTKKSTAVTKKVASKKTSTLKKASTKKENLDKKTAEKKATTKKTTTKKSTSTAKKNTAKKTTSTSKKTATKKATSVKKKATQKKVVPTFEAEYYDLPYGYNKTVVKLLAQTPKTLFVYWEIAENDKTNLKMKYGENFFEVTKPVLIIYNDTLNYSFEVDINDFANSWYIHINDSKCEYRVELGRRPLPSANHVPQQENIEKTIEYIPYYIYITSSNEMTAPNNKVLFNPSQRTIRFKNVKTGNIIERDLKDFSFITNFGIFTIRELYKYLYPNENFEYEDFFSGNPSSGNPSSGVFSSQFK